MRLPFLILFLLPVTLLLAQDTPNLPALLDSFSAEFVAPPGELKYLPLTDGTYLREHYRVFHRADKMEIRLAFSAEPSTDRLLGMPHVRTGLLVANLNSNEEGYLTTVHSFDATDLRTSGADWAALHTFRPKRSLSDYANAQLLTLYRHEVGYIHVLLLFKRMPPTAEAWHRAVRFLGRPRFLRVTPGG